jgi:DNA repair exonuclease SbcCD ATPase subunit
MRATIHNGRTSHLGAFTPKHNDRNFNINHAEHINPERVKLNRYWNWTGNPETTFEAAEAAFYEKHIRQHLDAQNARYTAQRHAERVKSMDEYRRSPQTCPEEVILMIGKAGDTIPADMMARIIQEQINWEQKQFPGLKVLDVALHMDEQGAPHIHERRAWVYTDKEGNLAISQNRSLEQMGVELPNPDKPRGRFNNRKQTFSKICREHLLQICREHGLDIEEIPQEKSRSGRTLEDYQAGEAEKRAAEAEHRRQFSEHAAESAEKQAESAKSTARSYEEHAEQVARQINNEYGELADAGLQKQEMQEQLEQLQERLEQVQEQLEYARADYKKAYQKCRRAERRAADLQNILTAAERRQVEQIRQEQEQEQERFEDDGWELE